MGERRKLKLVHKTARTPSKEVMAGQRQLARSSLRIVEAASNPIIITDSDYQVVYVNSKAQEFLGYETKELLGAHLDEQFSLQSGPDESSDARASAAYSRLSGERKGGEAFSIAALLRLLLR